VRILLEAVKVCRGSEYVEAVRFTVEALTLSPTALGLIGPRVFKD